MMARTQTCESSRKAHRDQPVVVMALRGQWALTGEMTGLLRDEANQRGWRLMDISLIGGFTNPLPLVGGIVDLLPTHDLTAWLHGCGCPIVRIGRLPHPDDPTVPSVLPDYHKAGQMAADDFAERGFRHIGLLGYEGMAIMQSIEQGLRQRAEAHGCDCHTYRFRERVHGSTVTGTQRASRYDQRMNEIAAWLAGLPRPLAVLTCTDAMAAQLCSMFQRIDLAVPEDVAVMSVGNEQSICELAPVPISAVDVNRNQMLLTAMRTLEELAQGRPVPPQTYVSPLGIETRRSTDILAVSDPLVARAVRFIWDQLDQNISVQDVAHAVGTPRYKLERLFRRHLDRGINAELQRVRLERFCQLLRNTTLPVADLAPRAGFSSGRYVHSVFRKVLGTTPRAYRLQSRGK